MDGLSGVEVRRVHVTGGPGSGKTTFARRLGEVLGAPAYDLDDLMLRHGWDLDQPAQQMREVADTDSWVTAGSYIGWTEPLFQRADIVLYLDIPWRVASYRILSRHLKAELARNNRFPGWGRLYRFWRWCARYYGDRERPGLNEYGVPYRRSELIARLAAYEAKLLTCRGNGDTERLLSLLSRRPVEPRLPPLNEE
jgi:adenylate kinase family enzyme